MIIAVVNWGTVTKNCNASNVHQRLAPKHESSPTNSHVKNILFGQIVESSEIAKTVKVQPRLTHKYSLISPNLIKNTLLGFLSLCIRMVIIMNECL